MDSSTKAGERNMESAVVRLRKSPGEREVMVWSKKGGRNQNKRRAATGNNIKGIM